jgi:hypothetical protein
MASVAAMLFPQFGRNWRNIHVDHMAMIFDLFKSRKKQIPLPEEIQSRTAGVLVEDATIKNWWRGQAIPIQLFEGKPVSIVAHHVPDDGYGLAQFIPEFDAAMENFLALGVKARAHAAPLIHKNCRDYIDSVDWPGREHLRASTETAENIWNFVEPREIIVERRLFNDMNVYVAIDCHCAWETEHGLKLVFRQGKQLTRVGPSDEWLTDADAHNMPDGQDALLSAWNG